MSMQMLHFHDTVFTEVSRDQREVFNLWSTLGLLISEYNRGPKPVENPTLYPHHLASCSIHYRCAWRIQIQNMCMPSPVNIFKLKI